jgi:hypothetical protein
LQQSTLQPIQDQIQYARRFMVFESQIKGGMNTFYWIAGLSMVNTVIFLTGGNMTFVIGLAFTQFIDALAHAFATDFGASVGTIFTIIGLAIDVFIAGLFCLFGYLGRKRFGKVIIPGIALYILDGILMAYFQDWFAVLFHILMLFSLIKGYKAINALKKLEKAYASGGLAATHEEIKMPHTQASPEEIRDKYRQYL